MSSSIRRARIRNYTSNPAQVTAGLAVQTVTIEFETVKATKMVEFGALSVTTAAVNAVLTTAWLTQVGMILNQNFPVVPNMSRADYVNVVQNTELKEGDLLLGTGNSLFKVFNPPLPPKTKVQINLTVNTLALIAAGPPGTCVLTPYAKAYDAIVAPGNRATFYAPIPTFPAPAGVTANTVVERSLGVFQRIEKGIIIISEDPLGTPVDSWLGFCFINADGEEIINLAAPSMKHHYSIMADGIATPAGYHMILFPEGGFEAAGNAQLALRLLPYLTTATGLVRGYEIYEKILA